MSNACAKVKLGFVKGWSTSHRGQMATLSEYAIKYQERGGIVEKVVTKDRSEIGNHERGGRQPRGGLVPEDKGVLGEGRGGRRLKGIVQAHCTYKSRNKG